MLEKVDERIEDYLRVAIADWTLQAFPEAPQKPSAEARSALITLAAVTREKHEDLWLTDFLQEPTRGPFSSAVKNLAESLHAAKEATIWQSEIWRTKRLCYFARLGISQVNYGRPAKKFIPTNSSLKVLIV